ncbi:MAG: S-layer protein, partial [Planctomycetaceae bacterium]
MRHGRATGALDTRWGVFSLIVWLGLCLPLPSHAADAVSYLNDVVPVLTKSGCNLGVCHAKAGGGQNGFQLSLLGFEPAEDHEQLTVADRGRRLALGEPERSLLLRKATGTVPHGGGVRLRQDSSGYQLLRDWISQGAHSDLGQAPRITRLEVDPAKATLAAG